MGRDVRATGTGRQNSEIAGRRIACTATKSAFHIRRYKRAANETAVCRGIEMRVLPKGMFSQRCRGVALSLAGEGKQVLRCARAMRYKQRRIPHQQAAVSPTTAMPGRGEGRDTEPAARASPPAPKPAPRAQSQCANAFGTARSKRAAGAARRREGINYQIGKKWHVPLPV